jgi:hypothetical protein
MPTRTVFPVYSSVVATRSFTPDTTFWIPTYQQLYQDKVATPGHSLCDWRAWNVGTEGTIQARDNTRLGTAKRTLAAMYSHCRMSLAQYIGTLQIHWILFGHCNCMVLAAQWQHCSVRSNNDDVHII